MEINPIILALSIHGRIYCGLDAEEALAVAEQTVELAMADNEADIVDLLDMFDDVWAASLLAGTIHDESTIPEHPLDNKTRVLNNASISYSSGLAALFKTLVLLSNGCSGIVDSS